MSDVKTGLDVLIESDFEAVRGQRVGLITNQTGVTRHFRDNVEAFAASDRFELAALFAPEHGALGVEQAGSHVADGRERRTGTPIHSLYGEFRFPSDRQLEGIDALVFDIQSVGVRYYTYLSTLKVCLEEAAETGRRFVVLDRPNPLGGKVAEGFPPFDERYRSFVSCAPVPIRHGLTTGEFARWLKDENALDVDLDVVAMDGWRREMTFADTGLPWIAPSPNMPTLTTAFAYPATCLIEGTNVSEGRGTTRPFELIGAPWLNAYSFCDTMNSMTLPGVWFRPAAFTPSFSKHANAVCEGAQMHLTDAASFRPTRTSVAIVAELMRQGSQFKFIGPESRGLFDLLLGTDAPRRALETGAEPEEVFADWDERALEWQAQSRPFRLYD